MLEGEIGPRMKFKGKEVLNWSLNNYLGLANQPEVREADAKAAKDWGLSYPMGARMMSGNSVHHEKLGVILDKDVIINEKTKVTIDELKAYNNNWLINYMNT